MAAPQSPLRLAERGLGFGLVAQDSLKVIIGPQRWEGAALQPEALHPSRDDTKPARATE